MAEADHLDPGWRWEDLEAARELIPEGQNAGLVALEARRRIPDRWPGEDQVTANLLPEKQLNDEQALWLRGAVNRAMEALVVARRLADMPKGRLEMCWSTTHPFPMLDQTHNMRSIANLLGMDAILRSHHNDPDGALASCRAILGACRAIGDEPTLMSMLVRSVLQADAVGKIERALAQGEPTEAALLALQRSLEDEERQPLLRIALRGERAYWNWLLEQLQHGEVHPAMLTGRATRPKGLTPIPNSEDLQLLSFGPLTNQRAALLRYLTDLVEILRLPEDRQDAEFDRVEKTLLKQPGVAGYFVPSAIRPVGSIRERQAQMRCAIVAVALERYRREHGRWPETLAELAPSYLEKVPVDPFDGQTLRYKRLKGSVLIYSVGADGVDNGGVLGRRQPSLIGPRAATDVGFSLWDVDQRRQPPPPPKNQ
jgi:hypothetical protein